MYVGIDIGASNTKMVVHRNNQVEKLPQFKTPCCAGQFLSSVNSTISPYLDKCKLRGLSLAVPGQVDVNSGAVLNVPNIKWLDNNVVERLAGLFECNVYTINDAKAGAIYELINGSLRDVEQGLYISMGTGLGGCAIVNAKPDLGQNGFAGEFGHMIICANGAACSCGRNGCWEAYASSRSILKTVRRMTDSDVTLASFAKKLDHGDSLSKVVFEDYMTYFEIGLTNLVYLYDPSVICFAGGTIEALPKIIPYVKTMVRDNPIFQNIELRQALGDSYACAEGALYRVLKHDFFRCVSV